MRPPLLTYLNGRRNKSLSSTISVDLHGLHVDEALAKVESVLDKVFNGLRGAQAFELSGALTDWHIFNPDVTDSESDHPLLRLIFKNQISKRLLNSGYSVVWEINI